MRRSSRVGISILGALCALATSGAPVTAQAPAAETAAGASVPRSQRPSLMVTNFDYATVAANMSSDDQNGLAALVAAMRGQPTDAKESRDNLGAGVADMVVDRLLEEGGFRIMERKALETVLGEQDLTGSGRAAAGQTVAQQAKLLGAKYLLTGSITKFGFEEKTRGIGLGGLGVPGVGAIGKKSRKTEVALTARIVDTSTGEIVASVKGEGISTKGGGFALGGAGRLGGLALGGNTSGVKESAIGEATELAVADLVKKLIAKAGELE